MRLTSYLRTQGYDLIEGPVRNHKPLQLWLKKSFDEIQLYYSELNHAFKSDINLKENIDKSLIVNSGKIDDYSFNIGITILDKVFKSLGLANIELVNSIKSGEKVSISYDNAITKVVPMGEIERYLSSADFRHPNSLLLQNANRNNIILISGVVSAKNLIANIDIDYNLDDQLITSLNKAAEGKVYFKTNSQKSLNMISAKNTYFPIAVKANRLKFNNGVFVGHNLVSDDRNWF